jgi:hypothetical protein
LELLLRKLFVTSLLFIGLIFPPTTAKAYSQELPRMSERRKYELSMKFVQRLAHCETHSNWKDRGNWSGGLGIARSTWIAFGGRQFAGKPHQATKKEQIIVANRIALWGFTHRDGRFVFPVGLGGWGGLDCARPVRLIRRRIDRSLAFSLHETGSPYKATP